MTPLRSMLFVPADSERTLAKAQTVPADALIVDLEDSVDAAHKDAARESAGEFLADRSSIRAHTLWLRINGVGDRHFTADVEAAVRARVDGIVLPSAIPHRFSQVSTGFQIIRSLPDGFVQQQVGLIGAAFIPGRSCLLA